ncbi:hypothetical protein BKA62DRAFT_673163 [Auriculariales sp. MPI-PUGE-AT-0066]|nr:hypothetical protein BKA62DRAFT_673163 [Auriculariales sp. MPI-PUGE-AT-0066]
MANRNAPPRLELNGLSSNNSDDARFNAFYSSISGFQVEAQGAEQTFNQISDGIMGARAQYQGVQNSALAAGVTALKAADPLQIVSKSMAAVSKFAENSQVILKGLEAVKTIHPFIGIIVTAAAAAIQLELTRRDNDKKVIALKLEMLAMMEVLLEYIYRPDVCMRNIKDAKKVDPDGNTIEGRMQRMVKDAEQVIRDCSATCEKYIHKKFIVKLFDGSRWEDRLAAFSAKFTGCKKEFEFALSIHTAQGVDEVQVTLTRFEASSKEGQDASHMILLFRQLESPKERDLQRWISERGGPKTVSENDKLFKELQAKMKDVSVSDKGKPETSEAVMIQIRDEMREDIDLSLAKDRKQFDRKFDAVQDKITDLQNTVHRSTDRVISAINAGPHDRIVDMDLHAIWKEMAWRGSVKARHFIVAVQDYFLQKYSKEDEETDAAIRDAYDGGSRPLTPVPMTAISDGPPPSAVLTKAIEARLVQRELQDRWAVEYITLTRVRPVLEAFDDDASGWISVKEANVFTSSRPQNYSVIKWLAFWAAGFKISSAHDAQSIQNLRAQMIAYSYNVLPCNRARVDKYLYNVSLDIIDYLTRAMVTGWNDDQEDESLMSHFNDYIDAEKARLKKALERFGWEIDASNTLQLIVGTGRIERHVLSLFSLLLERHTQIIQLAATYPLDDRELWDAERTIDVVVRSASARVKILASNFRNQNLDPVEEFQVVYGGMARPVADFEYDEEYYDWDIEPELSILKYGETHLSTPDYLYQEVNLDNKRSPATFEAYYTGTETYKDSKKRQDGFVLAKFELDPDTPAAEGQESLKGSGRDSYGIFTISGHWKPGVKPNKKRIEFKKTYLAGELAGNNYAYTGIVSFTKKGRAVKIFGHWGIWHEGPKKFKKLNSFIFDRTPSAVRRYRPSKEEMDDNPARARWNIALNVIQERVRRKAWRWSYFQARRDQRKAYVDAVMRIRSIADSFRFPRAWNDDGDEEKDHQKTVSDIQRALAPEDVLAYNFIADRKLQKECVHIHCTCDYCGDQIIGGYNRCLDCRIDGYPQVSIELCTDCSDKPATRETDMGDILKHHPSHNMLKSLRVLQVREIVLILRRCRDAVQPALDMISKAELYLNRSKSETDDNKDEDEDEGEEEEPFIPKCVYCDERVSKPCWYCTECSQECFICDSCEAEQVAKALDYTYNVPQQHMDHTSTEDADADDEGAADNDEAAEPADEEAENEEAGEAVTDDKDTDKEITHKWWHILNRVHDKPAEPPAVQLETRLSMLEQKFAAHEITMGQRLDRLESSITSVASKVDSEGTNARLDNMEKLLSQLLEKLAVQHLTL